MKKFFAPIILIVIATMTLGCTATQTMTNKVTTMTTGIDSNLYAQVPEENKTGIAKSEFDQMTVSEKIILAALNKDLKKLETKLAENKLDAIELEKDKLVVELSILKLEAIDRSGLGDREASIKNIADLKAKALKIEGNKIKTQAKVDTTTLKIKDIKNKINDQEMRIKDLKFGEDNNADVDAGDADIKSEDITDGP